MSMLLLLAMTSFIVRAASPYINQYKPEVEALISEVLQQPVKINEMKSDWRGIEPVFHLGNVIVYNDASDKALLRVDKLDVSIDIIASLFNLRLMPGYIVLSGAQISVRQDPQGRLLIDGMSRFQDRTQDESSIHNIEYMLKWLFSEDTISLEGVAIHYVANDGRILPIDDLNLSLVNRRHHHRIEGTAILRQMVTSHIQLSGKFDGDHNNLSNWAGEFSLKAKDLLVSQWLAPISYSGIHATNGEINFNLIGKLKHSQLETAHADLVVKNLELFDAGDKYRQLIQRTSGQFAFRRLKQGWSIDGSQIKFKTAGKTWPVNHVVVTDTSNALHVDRAFQLQHVNIEDITDFIFATNLLTPDRVTLLQQTQPHGELENLKWFQHDDSHVFQSNFRSVGWQAYQSIPGVNHFSGNVKIAPNKSQFHIYSHQLNLDMPALYFQPVVFDNVFADIMVEQLPAGYRITLPDYLVSSRSLNVSGSMLYEKNSSTDDTIQLLSAYRFNDIKNPLSYLPAKAMNAHLYQWLRYALQAGSGEGRVQINTTSKALSENRLSKDAIDATLNLAHTELAYWPGWAIGHDLTADVHLHNHALEAKISAGRLHKSQINAINLGIDDLRDGHQVLTLKGAMSSNVGELTDFIAKSPLREKFHMLETLSLSGKTHLDLDLKLPFDDTENTFKVNGSLALNEGELLLDAWPKRVSHIKGDIHFDRNEFYAKRVEANIADTPMKFEFATHETLHGDELVFMTSLQLQDKKIAPLIGTQFSSLFSGGTNVNTQLHIPLSDGQDIRIDAQSNLEGFESRLPHPFSKSKTSALPLSLSIKLGSHHQNMISVQLSKLLNAHIALNPDQQIESAQLSLGGENSLSHLPKQGIHVTGKIGSINMNEWMALVPPSSGNASILNELNIVNLHLEDLLFSGQHIKQLSVSSHQTPNATIYRLDSKMIAGDVTVPKTPGKIIMQLEHLHYKNTPNKKSTVNKRLNPMDLPALNAHIDNFIYDDHDIGEIELKLANIPDGIAIEKFSLANKTYAVDAKGEWSQNGKHDKTHLQGKLLYGDVAKMLKDWKIDSVISSHHGSMNYDLLWNKPPTELDLKSMNGDLHVNLQRGEISHLNEDTKNKIMLGKLFSILSLQTLPRRLVLDFSDLSTKDFYFQVLNLDMHVLHGVASLHDAYVDGPVASVRFSGDVDLVKEQCDLLLKVSPHLTASLPVVATIAGGPVAGIATWAASKVLNHQIGKVVSYMYTVKGPLNDPVIDEVKLVSSRAKDASVI